MTLRDVREVFLAAQYLPILQTGFLALLALLFRIFDIPLTVSPRVR